MAIPEDWTYKRIGLFGKKLPVAWIVEGTMSLQSCCPSCEYGRGYAESFIYGQASMVKRTCKACNTDFISLSSGLGE